MSVAHQLPMVANGDAVDDRDEEPNTPQLQAIPSSTPSRARTGDLLREREAKNLRSQYIWAIWKRQIAY